MRRALAVKDGRRALASGGLVVVLVAVAVVVSAEAQKPVREERMFVDGVPPPDTAAEMAEAADAVAVVKYTGKSEFVETTPQGERIRPGQTPGADVPLLPSTDHAFEVLEIVKWSGHPPQVGDEIRISLAGGTKDMGPYVRRIRVMGHTELVKGRSYVAFLHSNSRQNRLDVAWGGAGLLEINERRVRSVDRRSRRHDGKDATAFIGSLRAGKGKGR